MEGRDLFVPIRKIIGLSQVSMKYRGKRIDLRKFERRPGELLLAEDLQARHFINLVRGRLITATEIEVGERGDGWDVIGVDTSRRSLIRRLGARQTSGSSTVRTFVDFGSIQPFVAHVPSANLRIPFRKLARLHPAQIADLVEEASHEEGEEIIAVVGFDHELEADVYEELNQVHRLEFLATRSDDDASQLLSRMQPDDAADLLGAVDPARRTNILDQLPEPQLMKVRHLLSYSSTTAGGLMSTEFLTIRSDSTVAGALDAARSSTIPGESLHAFFVTNENDQVVGIASVAQVVRAKPTDLLETVVRGNIKYARPDWPLQRIALVMSDFNLTVLPVVNDEDFEMIGVITVDDLLSALLPRGWRREFGMGAVEE
jgi:CBS domain-containing protein